MSIHDIPLLHNEGVLASIDLNLLRTFVAIYRAQNLSTAAGTLRVSQPAVSHALRRLRLHFDDPLFFRTGTGVRPSRMATDLYAEISGPLSRIVASTEDGARFDPSTSRRRFRMALTDLGEAGLLPRILLATGRTGPGISIEVIPLDIDSVAQDVLSGEIDAAITSSPVVGPVNQEVLFQDRYACLVPSDLQDDNGRIRVEDLRRLPEARVGPSAGHRAIMEAVTGLGAGVLSPIPHVEVPRFTSLPWIVARCGFVAIVPIDAFAALALPSGAKLLELPLPTPTTAVHLISPHDAGGTSATAWFLDTVRSALAG
ncbi:MULTISPECIES: LysR substrate-binding domain-containing protein [unclassified Microbacterium]|uniref:LysR family transcriptional regulator n=1 Tax=unclassified Microbacterium TaxID=2609290 RepID=UPI00214BE3AC|nr:MULTISPECIES: LysR substrate-binding domain-containing protein [unclassified Microbacterium]MCR2808369.1 LysR substrate-binding domain-containing protein [Microbacterium sp. zg.B185]WIM19184.1 LysR substrate-binding domain-containing protein [Microbacterium sp. zg-B185]